MLIMLIVNLLLCTKSAIFAQVYFTVFFSTLMEILYSTVKYGNKSMYALYLLILPIQSGNMYLPLQTYSYIGSYNTKKFK